LDTGQWRGGWAGQSLSSCGRDRDAGSPNEKVIPLDIQPSDIYKFKAVARGMNRQASNPVSVSGPLPAEATSKEPYIKALHKYMVSVFFMLGMFLQLKQAAEMTTLFDTDYPTFVILIVALIIYGGSLIGYTYILYVDLNPDLAKFMSNIGLLFGALALVLELVILVPNLGLGFLFFWVILFVSFVVVYLSPYVKTLFTSAVGGVVQVFEKLKEYLNMIIACFTMEPEEQNGVP
ncbi:unnamed protein product, partial [Prunus brigantina]